MPNRDAQIELPLSAPRRRGGCREGAGRRPGPRPRMQHRPRGAFSRHAPCHVTLRVRSGAPSLREPRLVRAVERSFRAGCERGDFRLVAYSIQRDHVHLVVEADGAPALSRGMKALGARIALAVNRVFRRRGAVLADRFHHRVLRTPREVRNALAYVLLNLRKHAVDRWGAVRALGSSIDPASSGRWFDGWTRRRTATAEDPPCTSSPRTWLLRAGWRRHGLIDPAEIPGGRGSG